MEGEEGTAEVAMVLQDFWQGRGLGTVLLDDLLRVAEANGSRQFCAQVLADNHPMLALLSRLTDLRQRRTEQGVADVRFARRRAPAHAGHRPHHP